MQNNVQTIKSITDQLQSQSQADYNIASAADHRRVRDLADMLLKLGTDDEQLEQLAQDATLNLDVRVATKLAGSKRDLLESGWTQPLAVVMAMWGEQRRLRPNSAENPTGEDSLHVKLDQLDWLFDGTHIDWRIYAVDDGDPDDSAAVAAERAAQHASGGRVSLLRLSDAIPADDGPLRDLAHVDDSRKGGAIVYGASNAMNDNYEAVILTDADNSVDLGQIGLLIGAHARGAAVVVGDRKDASSVLVKAEARWGPGIVALRHMQRMVGRELFDSGLRDTQAAFKLYGREALAPILAAPSTYGFSFDSDWLFGAISSGHSIESVSFAFIDSFEESASLTQGPMTTWESLLRGLVAAARARGVDHDPEMAQVVDDLADAATLEKVVEQVPPQLAEIDPNRLGDRDAMTPADLRSWIMSLG